MPALAAILEEGLANLDRLPPPERQEPNDAEREKTARRRARKKLQRAIEAGELTVGECVNADDSCAGRMEAHHVNYECPLDVRWLCRSHHMRVHWHRC